MSWYQQFEQLMNGKKMGIDMQSKEATVAQPEEEGIINDSSGAGMVIDDYGNITMSARKDLGLIMAPDKDAMLVIAPNIHIFSSSIEKHDLKDLKGGIPGEYKRILKKVRGEDEKV